MIDVDAAVENTMVVFSAIEELRKDTEDGWKKLAVPLDQVIEANNASNVGLKKRDCQGHSSLDTPSELNPPQRIPSPLSIALLVPQAEG